MLLVGCQLERPPLPSYVRRLRFAEMAPREPLPKIGTAARWRKDLPESFAIALVVPHAAITGPEGPLRKSPETERAVGWALTTADALAAIALVLPTPSDLMPGARGRDLLAAYVEPLRKDGRLLVWAPGGAWQPEAIARVSGELGLTPAIDPFDPDWEGHPLAYMRLSALGSRRRYSETMLEELASRVAESEISPAYVAFDSKESFRDASRLQSFAAELEGE